MAHSGSLLIIPSGMYAWRPRILSETTAEDFSAAILEKSKISFLILGTGKSAIPLSAELMRLLTDASLPPEVMNSGAAVRIYNVLLAEHRPPAAALIAVD
jgi:uncharacterized protein